LNGTSHALAVLGSDLYVGGYFTTAGGKLSVAFARAYILPLPRLSIYRPGSPQGGITISWQSVDTSGFALEQTAALAPPASWVPSTASVTDDGTNKSATMPATNSSQLFRLRRP
jgi:hypothetical protein